MRERGNKGYEPMGDHCTFTGEFHQSLLLLLPALTDFSFLSFFQL